MYSQVLLLTFLLIISALGSISVASSTYTIEEQKPASWIIDNKPVLPDKLPIDAIEGGVYYVLTDNQIRVAEGEEPEYFFHHAELIVNQRGLENSSQININYDPVYESLVFHSLQIRRDNALIDKLSSAKISVIQRETELGNLIYDGQLTANVILDDVRVGDIIEYSYTLKGDNPVYKGKFAYQQYTEWSVPLYHQVIRVLWGKHTPLYITKLNTEIDVLERDLDSFREYKVEITDGTPKYINSQVPDWYNPYGIIFFSDTKEWSDVISWALPLYEKAVIGDSEVADIADNVRIEHTGPREQIAEALQFVQSEVRYLGIEMGVNSHTPAPAGQTLQRRYGDCKDKAALLISLLKHLGIQASPALVNTTITRRLADYPPMVNAFNHVLVKVWHGEEVFWLDPSRQYQKSGLANIYQPDYGYALVVKRGGSGLETMNERPGNSRLIVEDRFDLTKGGGNEVAYEVRSTFIGYEAEKLHYQIANDGLTGLQNQYLEFYRDYYTNAASVGKIKVSEDEVTGHIILEEKYLLKDFWETNTEERWFKTSFFANSFIHYLAKPAEETRSSPYSFRYPIKVKHTTDIIFNSDEWAFEDEEFIEDNRFFFFTFKTDYDKSIRTLKLIYEFETQTDSIAVQDFDKFMTARKRALDSTEYPIVEYFDSGTLAPEDEGNEDDVGTWILFALGIIFIGAILYVFINWRIDARNQPSPLDTVFFPVSLVKLFVLSIVTFGIYLIYWFYRNWLYVKKRDNSSIMPIARGFFNYFFFYPLYLRLVEDSSRRYQANRVLVKPVAILCALIYFTVAFLQNADYFFLPVLIVTPLLLFPLGNYINHIDAGDRIAYKYNSRWLLRHTVTAVLFLPLIMFTYGSELNILPSEKVVEGNRIWEHDIKYMQRNGVFPADEKIVLFYSDALFSIRDDGNGFTDTHVFSYWKDEKNKFNFKSASLSIVKDIQVSYAKEWDEETIITVVREDDSNFILYVSNSEGRDKIFYNVLKKKWEMSRLESPNI